MNEYLIYKILTTAVIASLYFYWKFKSSSNESTYSEPRETDDGKYAIPKPNEIDVNEQETGCEEVRIDPKFKDDDKTVQRLPDPKGTPTIRP
jgi:hypothetical protein